MEQDSSVQTEVNPETGLTQQEEQNIKIQGILGRLKYYWGMSEPVIVKILNSVIYTTIKFVKTMVTMIFKMALGKDV
jgi:hypothetical protein